MADGQSPAGFDQIFLRTSTSVAMHAMSRPMNSGHRNGALPKLIPATGDSERTSVGRCVSDVFVAPETGSLGASPP
jgi:hypothetical protein